MKKVNLYWRLFQVSVIVFGILSFVAVSRPLEDTTLDQISMCLPFIWFYYTIIGIHRLRKYEEKQMYNDEEEKGKQKVHYPSKMDCYH
jgi:hypothetical protein